MCALGWILTLKLLQISIGADYPKAISWYNANMGIKLYWSSFWNFISTETQKVKDISGRSHESEGHNKLVGVARTGHHWPDQGRGGFHSSVCVYRLQQNQTLSRLICQNIPLNTRVYFGLIWQIFLSGGLTVLGGMLSCLFILLLGKLWPGMWGTLRTPRHVDIWIEAVMRR